jgi:hypothetical protein
MTPASDDPEIAAKAAGRERGRDWALERAGYVWIGMQSWLWRTFDDVVVRLQ